MSDWFDRIVEKNTRCFAKPFCKWAACGPGWQLLLYRAFESIEAHLAANPEVLFMLTDIKEKYGTLRFYYHGGDDKIEAIVEEAEFWSARTCDMCGNPGILSGRGWLQTRCPEHKPEGAPWCQKLTDWEHSDE